MGDGSPALLHELQEIPQPLQSLRVVVQLPLSLQIQPELSALGFLFIKTNNSSFLSSTSVYISSSQLPTCLPFIFHLFQLLPLHNRFNFLQSLGTGALKDASQEFGVLGTLLSKILYWVKRRHPLHSFIKSEIYLLYGEKYLLHCSLCYVLCMS